MTKTSEERRKITEDARASAAISGIKEPTLVRHYKKKYISGELDIDEVLQAIKEHYNQKTI